MAFHDGPPVVGATLVLTLDGQKVTGQISEIHPDRLVVTIPVRHPAKGYKGVEVRTRIPGGQTFSFDMGAASYFSQLVIEVPLPEQALEAAEAPVETASAPRPMPAASERRHFYRFAVDLPVDVMENVGHTREYVRASGKTMNLSGGGMLVEFGKPMLPGVYSFRVHLPGEEMLVQGRVISKGDPKSRVMPVEFVDLHEMDRSKLIRFIFTKMRNIKTGASDAEAPTAKADKSGDEPRHLRRRDKFFKPTKPRYW